MEEVSNYRQKIQFITGFAGSGKSTKLAEIAKDDVLVLTPTHAAAAVLRAKGVKNVATIHSVLKLVPTIDQNFRKGQKLQRLTKMGTVDLKYIRKIAIDEFSMLPTHIMDMLLAVLPAHALIIVVGDPYQLSPVDGDAIDPLMYTDNIIELTTQHRAEAPEVVETFMRFMNYIKTGKEMNLVMNPAIQYGSLRDFNPDTDRAVAYTNATVINLNTLIAKYLKLPEEISAGEDILANVITGKMHNTLDEPIHAIYPSCVSKGKLLEGQDLLDKVETVEDDMMKYGTDISQYPICHIVVEEEIYHIHYDLHHYATAKMLKAEVESAQLDLIERHGLADNINLPEWCKSHRTHEGVKRRGEAWKEYLSHQSLVFDLRRPFATTVHKTQGKEFSTVYIAQDDIKRAIRRGNYIQYARLMYVALSRATKKVVLV